MIKKEDLAFLEKIEEYLLQTNVDTEIVEELMNGLTKKLFKSKSQYAKQDLIEILKLNVLSMMTKYVKNFDIESTSKPYVMLVCGINGSGKTTTIGKMVKLLNEYNWNVLVASCDTYRAAAENQLQSWVKDIKDSFIGKENDNDTPSKIAARAYNTAVRKQKDVLIIDTSGRLQNNQDLMAELVKLKQKLKEFSYKIPHDVVLVVDATCGYNAIEQAKMYNELIGITGIILTKTDISQKAGAILSICKQFNLGIFGVSNGEEKNDIDDFDPKKFTEDLFCNIDKIM